MYACIDACMHIGLCLFVCLCVYLCMYACVNVCSMRMHACTHICLCGVYDLSNAACHKISVEWHLIIVFQKYFTAQQTIHDRPSKSAL